MKGYIDSIDFINIEPMKYWSIPAAKQCDAKNIVHNAIFSGQYGGTLKVDGYYERIIKDEDGQCYMIARSRNVNGEVVNKIEWLPQINSWLASLPNGTCFLTECYKPGEEGSKGITSILGCLCAKAIERQRMAPLHLYVFDIMAYDGKVYLNTPYVDRITKVMELSKIHSDPYIDYAVYYEGQDLWNYLQEYLTSGREGMVIMRKDATVYQKRTPARISIKVKKELSETIDCVVMGANPPAKEYTGKELETWPYWQNVVTGEKIGKNQYKGFMRGDTVAPVTKTWFNNWAGSLKIGLYRDGELVHFGDLSGITDEVKANWRDYVGKVVEVGGMELFKDTGTNAIRHPKLVAWRNDKSAKDCVWGQVE